MRAAELHWHVLASGRGFFFREMAFLMIIFLFLLAPPLQGHPEHEFDAANKLYEQGQFSEATKVYEDLLQTGAGTPAVFFNLGNTYFKSGKIGQAILNYRHAQQIAPRDPEIRSNLQFARGFVLGGKPGTVAYWRQTPFFTFNELSFVAIACGWVFFGLLTIQELIRRSLRFWTFLAALVFIVSSAFLFTRYHHDFGTTHVIVAKREGKVHRGPLEESPVIFHAPDGTEFKVIDQKDQWLKVTDESGHRGWIEKKDVIFFRSINPAGQS